jgi:integrase
MGSAEIRSLKYKHFIRAIEDGIGELTEQERLDIYKIKAVMKDKNIIGTWHIMRQKTSIPYITFSTSESIHGIIDHLIYRKEYNKPIKSLEDYLFSVNGNKMRANTLTQVFQDLNDRCGFGKVESQRLFVSHNLRKFTANTLIDNGMDFYRVEWILGHALPSTQASYYKMNLDVMKKEYSKYEDYLTFNKKVNDPSEIFRIKGKLADMETMLREQNELLSKFVYQ